MVNSANLSVNSASAPHNPFLFLSNLPNYVSIKLDSSNFVLWNFQISAVLRGFSLFGFVDGSSVCPKRFLRTNTGEFSGEENPEYLAWIAQDQALLAMINATLSPAALSYVVGQTTARGVWTTLSRRFTSVSRSNILDLKIALHDVRMNGDSIDSYLQRIKNLRDQLSAVNVFFTNEEILHITLKGLPPEFHGLRTAIRARNDPIPLEDLHVLLLSEERSITEVQETVNTLPNAMAMAAFKHNSNNGKGKFSGNNKGKASFNNNNSNFNSTGYNQSSGNSMPFSGGYGGNFSSGNFMPFSGKNGGHSSRGNTFGGYDNTGFGNSGIHNSYGNQSGLEGYGGNSGYGHHSGYGNPSSSHSQINHGANQAGTSNSKGSGPSGSMGNKNKQVAGNIDSGGSCTNTGSSYSNGGGSDTNRPICQICNLPGHVALDCYHRMNFSFQGRHPPARLAAMAAVTNPDTSSYWLTDSGANHHITADMNNLAVTDEYEGIDEVVVGKTYGEGPLQRPE